MRQLPLVFVGLVGLVGGCDLDRVVGLTSDPGRIEQVARPLRFSPLHSVDILLVLDDSSSMSSKQAQLREQLPLLLGTIANSAGNLSTRLGVITTDLGAPGIACGSNRGAKLQGVGAAAPASCKAPVDNPWITIEQQPIGLPPGQSLDETINCMTSVGQSGCGFEMPLEAAYRFFSGTQSQSFLRNGAITVVVFVTDEDDCSTDSDSNVFLPDASLGLLNSFRCARLGFVCDGQPVPNRSGTYASCRPATPEDGGKLTPIDRYVRLFNREDGALAVTSGDVILAALRAPPTPVSTIVVSGSQQCGSRSDTCIAVAPSCIQLNQADYSGTPAVRLASVIEQTSGVQRSICDASYQPFANDMISRVQSSLLGAGCIPGVLLSASEPDCRVSIAGVPIPHCRGEGGPQPCWDVDTAEVCPAQVDPRNGRTSQQRIIVVGTDATNATGTCNVLRTA